MRDALQAATRASTAPGSSSMYGMEAMRRGSGRSSRTVRSRGMAASIPSGGFYSAPGSPPDVAWDANVPASGRSMRSASVASVNSDRNHDDGSRRENSEDVSNLQLLDLDDHKAIATKKDRGSNRDMDIGTDRDSGSATLRGATEGGGRDEEKDAATDQCDPEPKSIRPDATAEVSMDHCAATAELRDGVDPALWSPAGARGAAAAAAAGSQSPSFPQFLDADGNQDGQGVELGQQATAWAGIQHKAGRNGHLGFLRAAAPAIPPPTAADRKVIFRGSALKAAPLVSTAHDHSQQEVPAEERDLGQEPTRGASPASSQAGSPAASPNRAYHQDQ